ncbi:MAG: alpha/beta hydrolase [Chromatiales bacterium]|nr:alpha/beta hydrolase [Chromatiales bacterium]
MGTVVAGLGAVTYFYQRDIQQARARVASGSQIAQTPCGPIEYAVAGDGPPVLVVHGAGGGFDQGLDFSKPLVERGFRVIAMSRFGYLRTPLPADATPAAQADAHACLLDALRIQRAAILGISAGAPSLQQFALRHPQRTTALILVVPAAYRPPSGDDTRTTVASNGVEFLRDTALRLDFLFWAWIRFAPDSVTRVVLATDPALVASASREEQAEVAMVREHILPVSPRRSGLLNEARVMSSLERYPLERITAPTLAISAQDDYYDTYESARYTAAQVPRARFLGYPTGGHLLVGHGQEVMAEITQFLKARQE